MSWKLTANILNVFQRFFEGTLGVLFEDSGVVALPLRLSFEAVQRCWMVTVGLSSNHSIVQLTLFPSSCARFFGNLFLFFLLPFAGCISLCFCRSRADENFGSEDSFLGKQLTRKQLHYDEESDVDNEDTRLLRPTPPSSDYSAAFDRHQRSSETVFDIRSNPFAAEDEIEDDTSFVVNAIKESHESLRKLVSE